MLAEEKRVKFDKSVLVAIMIISMSDYINNPIYVIDS